MKRTIQLVAVLLIGLSAVACGGGGGGGGGGGVVIPPMPLVADFSPESGCGGSSQVLMRPGAATDEIFEVEIYVNGINNFFSAGFNVTFDDTLAEFTGTWDNIGSFIGTNPGMTEFLVTEQQGNPGVVNVFAGLKGNNVAGISTSGDEFLLKLEFEALDETTGTQFAYELPGSIQVCPTAGQACIEAGATVTFCKGSLSAARM